MSSCFLIFRCGYPKKKKKEKEHKWLTHVTITKKGEGLWESSSSFKPDICWYLLISVIIKKTGLTSVKVEYWYIVGTIVTIVLFFIEVGRGLANCHWAKGKSKQLTASLKAPLNCLRPKVCFNKSQLPSSEKLHLFVWEGIMNPVVSPDMTLLLFSEEEAKARWLTQQWGT